MNATDPSPDDLAREVAADPRLADRRDWTLLGTGGFGSVFRVDHDDLGRREAVKVLRRALDPAAIEEFRREARLMGSIGPHPYLLTVFDAGVLDSGRPYVVAEYVPGGSLQQRLADGGSMPWADAVALCGKVSAGLQRCHDAGVLHLDIKPANILIDADGQPRLADFGVARTRLGSGVTTGAPEESALIATTIAYSPPELLEGRVSEATDVYMLAATLHALCCGHPPFPRPRALVEHGVPPAVVEVIERALDPDPDRRPSSAAELASELATAAKEPDQPRSVGNSQETGTEPRPGGRGGRTLLGVALVVLVAGVIAGWMLFRDDSSTTSSDRVRQVSLEPALASGEDPFSTDSLAADFSGVGVPAWFQAELAAAVDGQALRIPGTEPGLYGGSSDEVCNVDALIEFLADSQEKAAAFAGALGIEPADIPAYVRRLAPVVLQTDTWVTNHGFRDGRATPRQSVLQRGTAVLVDDLGIPRVRCSCGNPLTPPAGGATNLNLADRVEDGAELSGEPWPGFAPAEVVTIAPGPEPVTELEVIDVTSGNPLKVRVGDSANAELPSSFLLPVPRATGANAPGGMPCPPVDTTVVDGGAAGTTTDGNPWSVTVVDARAVGAEQWLVVLNCRVLRANRPLVALVARDASEAAQVVDARPADSVSSETPFHAFDEDDTLWVSSDGTVSGALVDGPDTIFERSYRVEGGRIVEGTVVIERVGARHGPETADLGALRAACGALEDAMQYRPLTDLFRAGYLMRVGVDDSGVPFAVAYDEVRAVAAYRRSADWAESPPPALEVELATAQLGGFPGGALDSGVLGCYSDDARAAYAG